MISNVALRDREGQKYGGSAEGIRSHYDIGNDFWEFVLGPSMAYSCAMYASADEGLDAAQARKVRWHIKNSGALEAKSVLDIGCGWGSVLRPLSEQGKAKLIRGLTLSDAQLAYFQAKKFPAVDVRVENWAVHQPEERYDAIISVGAFEHFAKPKESREEKIAVYRDFFERCHKWLNPSGRMSLQTIAYGNMRREDASAFINDDIFPESDLPYLSEIVEAIDGLFEIVSYRNDRLDYARTMETWGRNMQANRARAVEIVGESKTNDMERFFKMAAMGFRMGKQGLFRFALRPVTSTWLAMGADNWGVRNADVAQY